MSKFLFGAVYIIEQDYTDGEMRRDLANMRACGFDLITLWPVGNAWLAKSSHEWIFTKTRYVLDLCEEMGMKAILQLFGQNQAQEFMPDAAQTPEMESADQYGIWINENSLWANLNHPVVRDYFDTYFREAITALKDHPAVYAWDVFNESHHRTDDEWTTRKYQTWLRKKYGTIETLNRQWYRRYESFAQVRPEKRRASYSIWSSLLPAVDYEKFRAESLTETCRFLYETAKKYDNVHPIMIDGTSAMILVDDLTLRNCDEFETAYVPDIYGATFYPKSWGKNFKNTPWTLSMYYAIPAGAARKAHKPYFVNELQTHTQSVLTPGSEVSCEELASWTLMCIFSGTAGMQLWRWRPFLHGYQATGRGLTRMNGQPNKRAAAVQSLLEVVHKNSVLFDNFKPVQPAVRIAYSYEGRLFFDSLLKFGVAGKTFWAKNMEGWYKLFWNWGMPIEMTDLDRLNGDDFKTPVLVVPGAVCVKKACAEKLCEYVENGGILIADGRMGSLDEWGCVPPEGIPGNLLSRLFGVVEADVDSGGRMLAGGQALPTGFETQELELTDPTARVLATMEDGTPAVVQHTYGKGQTLYFNNFEGLVLLEKLWPELQTIVAQSMAGMPGVRAQKDEHVHLSYIESETQQAMLAVNFSEKAETVTLTGLPEGAALTELFTGATLAAGPQTVLALPAASHSVYVWNCR